MRWAVVTVVLVVISVSSSAFAQSVAEQERKPICPEGTFARPKDGCKDPDLNTAWAAYG